MEIETVDLVLDSPTPPDGMYLEFAKAFKELTEAFKAASFEVFGRIESYS
jgi:hypothetical protein